MSIISLLFLFPLIVVVSACVVTIHERMFGETSRRWKIRCGHGTYSLRVSYTIHAVYRHVTDKAES